MQFLNFGLLKRAGVCLKRAALVLSAALLGCQSSQQALQQLALSHDHQLEVLSGNPFPLMLSTPLRRPDSARLRVYLEGDGHAWATATQPSLDPTPHHLLVARLAFEDPTPSLYLARPCQFISAPACQPALWTQKRFSAEVLDSLNDALKTIKARYGNQSFELIGYSGGGALALLLASQRDDIAQVQTLAGNLSPREWATLLKLSALTGSLDPLDYRQRLALLPQRHFFGSADRVVPPQLLTIYRQALGNAVCLESISVPGASHIDGWNAAWHQWRNRPLKCNPHY